MWKQIFFRQAPKSRAGPPETDRPRLSKQADADNPFADLMAKLDRIPYPASPHAALGR